jgi:hypothetical protein
MLRFFSKLYSTKISGNKNFSNAVIHTAPTLETEKEGTFWDKMSLEVASHASNIEMSHSVPFINKHKRQFMESQRYQHTREIANARGADVSSPGAPARESDLASEKRWRTTKKGAMRLRKEEPAVA